MNWYAYVGNDPVNGKDPTGEWGFVGALIGGVASGAAAYLSGERGWDVALAAAGGALVGAATGGAASVGRLGGMLSAKAGMGASTATGVSTVAVMATSAGAGNATSQVTGMVLDVAQGKEARKFDAMQVATATGIGAVGATVPALAMAGEMGLTSTLSAGTFEAVTSVSGVSTTAEVALGGIAAATETAVGLAVEQAKKVYVNKN